MAKTRTEIQGKYDRANTKSYPLKFNLKTDADIIERLEQETSKQGFIKQCIRAEIERRDNMRTYKIKEEYIDKWGSDANDETIVTYEQVKRFAHDWEITVDELLEQLEEQ